jgi:type III restriction enzyme
MMVKTAQSSFIQKTPGVCGGNARIRNTRIPVWTLVSFRKLGTPDSELLESYPSLTQDDLDLAWSYYSENQEEIDLAIADQDFDNEEC